MTVQGVPFSSLSLSLSLSLGMKFSRFVNVGRKTRLYNGGIKRERNIRMPQFFVRIFLCEFKRPGSCPRRWRSRAGSRSRRTRGGRSSRPRRPDRRRRRRRTEERKILLFTHKNGTKSVFAHLLQVQQEPDAYPVRAGRLRHGAPVAVRAAHPVGLGAAAAGALDVAAVALPFFMFGRIRGECTIVVSGNSTIALLSRWCC